MNLTKLTIIVWPIKQSELKKFFPLSLLLFLLLFNYNCLRGVKDSLIITKMGIELINWVKLYLVIPISISFVGLYIKFLEKYGEEQTYYIVTGFFIIFFTLFTFILYPNEELFHPSEEQVYSLLNKYPDFKLAIIWYSKWIYSSLFIFTEIYGSLMLTVMYWQFANKINTITEAKRFYPMLAFIGNLAFIIAGLALQNFAIPVALSKEEGLSLITDDSGGLVSNILSFVIIANLMAAFIYRWMNDYVLTEEHSYFKSNNIDQPILSFKESIYTIFKSRYLRLIGLIIILQGISTNLIEVTWQHKVRELYPTTVSYAYFMGDFLQFSGMISILILIVSINIVRIKSWLFAANFISLTNLVVSTTFIIFCLSQYELAEFCYQLFGISPLVIAVLIGAFQTILNKSIKYTMFDSTKEMTYMPLSIQEKTKCKAIIDVISSRIGKSGVMIIHSIFMNIFSISIYDTNSSLLLIFFITTTILWIIVNYKLSSQYEQKLHNHNLTTMPSSIT